MKLRVRKGNGTVAPRRGAVGVTKAVRGKGVISRVGSSVEGGGGLPRRTKWRKIVGTYAKVLF
jgi:hypothetical protein